MSRRVAARQRAMTKLAGKPELFPLVGAFAGPERMPEALLAEDFPEQLFG